MNDIPISEEGEPYRGSHDFKEHVLQLLKPHRREILRPVLFHEHGYSETEQRNIEATFLTEKEGKNMGEVMDMALRPPNLGVIRVVELGKTDHPGRNGEIDGLKNQYRNLLRGMKRDGWLTEDLPRLPTTRQMIIQPPMDNFPDIHLVTRLRMLIDTRQNITNQIGDKHYEDEVDIKLAKRMVFGMHKDGVNKACRETGYSFYHPDYPYEDLIQEIEKYMDSRDASIIPIRTEYFLETQIINELS